MDAYIVYAKEDAQKENIITAGLFLHEVKELAADAVAEQHPNYQYISPIQWTEPQENIYEGICTMKTVDGEITVTYIIERVDSREYMKDIEARRKEFYEEAR